MSADPQVVSTSVSQVVSFWEDSASQAASASPLGASPQTVSSQVVSSQAVSFPQAGSSWEDSSSQAASTSSQTQRTNSQGDSTTLPQAHQASI